MNSCKFRILILLLFFSAFSVSAQVKIGSNPMTIQDGSLLELETNGTRAGLKLASVALTGTDDAATVAVTAASAGTMVYNTATAGAGATAVAPGYYVWTGTEWQKIVISADGELANIYTVDDTLAGNRIVNLNSNSLSFDNATGTGAVNQFSVDDSTFTVDALNNRVGIGTTAPEFNLEANGSVAFPDVKDTIISGPYSALGINTNTGQIGTYTPGAQPLYTRISTQEQLISTSWITLALVTGAGAISPINSIGVIENNTDNYLEFPQGGLFRFDVTLIGAPSGSFTSGTGVNTRILKAPAGSNTFAPLQLLRHVGTADPFFAPFLVSFFVQLDAGERIRIQSIRAAGTADCSVEPGTGGTYSQLLTVTKL